MSRTGGRVVAVCARAGHSFAKDPREHVRLLAGLGVEGDGHAGATVQHRSRVARDPSQPNLRQVHLIATELHTELRAAGWTAAPGALGENVTTEGVDLLALPVGALLGLGDEALLALTGLRNPCAQIDAQQPGLLKQVAWVDDSGHLVRRAGVMAVVVAGGVVRPGDAVTVSLPPGPHRALDRV